MQERIYKENVSDPANDRICRDKKETEDTDKSSMSNWELFHCEGLRLFKVEKKYREAIEAFSKAISHAEEAQRGKSDFARALVYYELSDYSNVINDCTTAINFKFNFEAYQISKLYSTRGMAYKHKGDIYKANADFEMTAKLFVRFE